MKNGTETEEFKVLIELPQKCLESLTTWDDCSKMISGRIQIVLADAKLIWKGFLGGYFFLVFWTHAGMLQT